MGINDFKAEFFTLLQEGPTELFEKGDVVAIATEVDEEDLFPSRLLHLRNEGEGVLVGKVAVAAPNALFHGPWALGVVFKELVIVIGLDDEDIGFADVFLDKAGDVAQIGDPGQAPEWGKEIVVSPLEDEADRVVSVVGDGEGGHLEIPELEMGSGFKDFPIGPLVESLLDGPRGIPVGKKAEVSVFGEAA